MKRNVPLLGYAIGLICPIIGSAIIYLLLFRGMYSFSNYYQIYLHDFDKASKAISLSLLFNLAPFLYCIKKNYDYTLRGIVSATIFPYFVLFLLYKFVL